MQDTTDTIKHIWATDFKLVLWFISILYLVHPKTSFIFYIEPRLWPTHLTHLLKGGKIKFKKMHLESGLPISRRLWDRFYFLFSLTYLIATSFIGIISKIQKWFSSNSSKRWLQANLDVVCFTDLFSLSFQNKSYPQLLAPEFSSVVVLELGSSRS